MGQWAPAVLFYLIYVAAMIIFVVQPAIEKNSLARAIGLGAFFGFAAYTAFDLTSLALLKDFPLTIAIVGVVVFVGLWVLLGSLTAIGNAAAMASGDSSTITDCSNIEAAVSHASSSAIV